MNKVEQLLSYFDSLVRLTESRSHLIPDELIVSVNQLIVAEFNKSVPQQTNTVKEEQE